MQRNEIFGRGSDRGPSSKRLELQDIKFGTHQHEHLQRLIDRCGSPTMWGDAGDIGRMGKLTIVTRPPSGPQADRLCRSLQPDSVVVIPFGESPSFDFLKSKLVNFGTISPSGADGPHELWWGGASWSALPWMAGAPTPLIVSCYPRHSGATDARRITQSLKALNLDHIVEPIDNGTPDRLTSGQKIQFILDIWSKANRPVLWIHPDAVVARPISMLESIACDFAVHKWRGWEMATRTLYFGQSAAAGTLLRTWQTLTKMYPQLWEGNLLDQAWSLVASQRPFRTIWLPRCYHGLIDELSFKPDTVIAHNLPSGTGDLNPQEVPALLQAARRASRAGSPGPHLFLKASSAGHRTALVMINNLHEHDAHQVAAVVERVAAVFALDSGCFGHLELSVCNWKQDLKSGYAAAEGNDTWAIAIDPTERVPGSLFRDIGRTLDSRPSQDRIVRMPWVHPRITTHLIQHP